MATIVVVAILVIYVKMNNFKIPKLFHISSGIFEVIVQMNFFFVDYCSILLK